MSRDTIKCYILIVALWIPLVRKQLEARTQIRRLIEQSRCHVTKAWINIAAMFIKENWTGFCD